MTNPTSHPFTTEPTHSGPHPDYRTVLPANSDRRNVSYPVHRDHQIELVLALEELLTQAEADGAHPDDLASALNYVTNRPRPSRYAAQDGCGDPCEGEDQCPS